MIIALIVLSLPMLFPCSKSSYIQKNVIATAYTDQDPGCNQITATGRRTRTKEGKHVPGIAVDPKYIRLGSKISIDNGNTWILADDTGGAIKGGRIDIRMPSRHAAKHFGRQRITILIQRRK